MISKSCRALAWIWLPVWLLLAGAAPAQEFFVDRDGFIDSPRYARRFLQELHRLANENETTPIETLQAQFGESRTHALDAFGEGDPFESGEALYARRAPAVVGVGFVQAPPAPGQMRGRITGGVIVRPDGYILTNHHVLRFNEGDRALGVMTYDGRVFPVREILAANEANDLALIRIDAEGLPFAPLARGVAIGERVATIHHPRQNFYTYTEGVVSGKAYRPSPLGNVRRLSITADFARGSSGSPIFNMRGEVVGLVQATANVRHTTDQGQDHLQMVWKYCVPYTAFREMLAP